MDQMMIENKMVGEIMNQGEVGHGNMVEEMKNALEQEIVMEEKIKMAEI